MWQLGAQGNLYKASRFLLIPVVLPLLLFSRLARISPNSLTRTFMYFTAHAVN